MINQHTSNFLSWSVRLGIGAFQKFYTRYTRSQRRSCYGRDKALLISRPANLTLWISMVTSQPWNWYKIWILVWENWISLWKLEGELNMVPERWRIKSLITSHLHHITTTSDIVVSTETENKATSFSFHDLLGSVLEPSKNLRSHQRSTKKLTGEMKRCL